MESLQAGSTQKWICLLLAVCTEREVNSSRAIQVVPLSVFRCSPELLLKLVAGCDGKSLPTERLNQRDSLYQKNIFLNLFLHGNRRCKFFYSIGAFMIGLLAL